MRGDKNEHAVAHVMMYEGKFILLIFNLTSDHSIQDLILEIITEGVVGSGEFNHERNSP